MQLSTEHSVRHPQPSICLSFTAYVAEALSNIQQMLIAGVVLL